MFSICKFYIQKIGMRLLIIYDCNAMQISFPTIILMLTYKRLMQYTTKAQTISSNDVNHSIIFIKWKVSISMNISWVFFYTVRHEGKIMTFSLFLLCSQTFFWHVTHMTFLIKNEWNNIFYFQEVTEVFVQYKTSFLSKSKFISIF